MESYGTRARRNEIKGFGALENTIESHNYHANELTLEVPNTSTSFGKYC